MEWDTDRTAEVYRDERYTLGQKDGQPYVIAGGERYMLSCHPFEPCLYIKDKDGALTAVHNAFDPFVVLECFSNGQTVASITGYPYGPKDFCRMVEHAAGMGNIRIDDAEEVFGKRPRVRGTAS